MEKIIFAVSILITLSLSAQVLPTLDWSQTYSFGSAESVIVNDDGSYMVVGHNGENFWYSSYSYYLNISSTGEIIWANTNDVCYSVARSIKKSNIDNYYITGTINQNAFLEKINSDGESLSFYTYDYANGNDIALSPSNNILIAFESVQGYVAYTDDLGNPIWTNTYPYFINDNSNCTFVQFLDNGNILIAGNSSETVCGSNLISYFLTKADSLGNDLWTYHNQFESGNATNPTKVIVTNNGDFVFTAMSNKLIKVSSDGELIWESETLDYFCEFNSIKTQNYNGEQFYFIIANVSGNYHLLKYGDLGSLIWDQAFEFDSNDSISDFVINDDNSFLLVGKSDNQLYVAKLNSEITNSDETSYNENSIVYFQNYPNPFNPTTTIKYSIQNNSNVKIVIFNVKGQKIKTLVNSKIDSGINQVIWNGTDDNGNLVGSGIYYYKLNIDGEIKAVNKCILMK